jgi:hypothetical protein
MGEGTTRVEEADPDDLKREAEEIRADLTGIAGELDRRRHEALDWQHQVERHKTALVLTAAGLGLLVGGAVAVAVRQKRQRNRPLAKAQRLGRALSRMIEEPDRVAPEEPSVTGRVLRAVVSGAAGLAARQLAARWNAVREAPPRP